MASDPPSFDAPDPSDPSVGEEAGAYSPGANQPREHRAYDGPAPFGSRMMPNDYPPGYPPYAPYQPEKPRTRTPLWVKLIGGCLIAGVLVTVILACTIAATAGSVVALFNSTPVSATTSQTFAVAGVPTVRIHNSAGNIHVVRGGAGAAVVQATKYVRGLSSSDAQTELRQITVTTTQSGDTLNIQVNEPSIGPGIHLWGTDQHVDLTITVPAQANIAADLNAGNVDVTDIAGTIGVQNDAGNLSLNHVTLAGSSFATDNAGNIDVTGVLQPGASFEARTNAGNVTARLPRATSAHLTASTTAGSVSVDSVWPVNVSRQVAHASASGDLTPNPSGTLVLETNAGNVTLDAA